MENGAVYVIYTIKQMADNLNRSKRTVKTALAELENAGLIQRVRHELNRANHIYLKLPDEVQFSSPPEGNDRPWVGKILPIVLGKFCLQVITVKRITKSVRMTVVRSRTALANFKMFFLQILSLPTLQAL